MANPIDITSRIYKVLTELFGPKFARDMIGTATNVTKPVKLDPNAPTAALYSKGALRSNPGAEGLAEQKIMEYAPTILSNKNKMEQMNFLENAETLLEIRKGKTTKDGVPIEKTKPEENFFENTEPADVIDLKTKTKVDEKGIASLKDRFGLPEGIDPKSTKGQFIQSIQRAEANSPEAEKLAEEGLENFLGFGREVQGPDLLTEARRRAVVRQILLEDNRIDLPPAIRKSLKNRDDLAGGADQNLDPLNIYDTYYERNITKLEALDGIIEGEHHVGEDAIFKGSKVYKIPVRETNDFVLTVTADSKKNALRWVQSHIASLEDEYYRSNKLNVPVEFYDLEAKKPTYGKLVTKETVDVKRKIKRT